jgi:hypothetical protein
MRRNEVQLSTSAVRASVEQAWPKVVEGIRHDAQRPLEKDLEVLHEKNERLKDRMDHLFDDVESAQKHRRDAEARVNELQAQVDTLQKRINEWSATGEDPCDIFNQPSPEPEEVVPSSPGPSRTSKKDRKAATAPYFVRPPKFAANKPKPVGDPPISETGQIPRPLGKTPIPRAKEWFETCPVDDEDFVALYKQCNAIPKEQRHKHHHVVIHRMSKGLKIASKDPAFPILSSTPEDVVYWLKIWTNSPEGTPAPIREEADGSMSIEDMDIWMWARKIKPATYASRFADLLWGIFQIPKKWESLVKETQWVNPAGLTLRTSVVGAYKWTAEPKDETEATIARWLGANAGVTPQRASIFLEPYAARRANGTSFNSVAQASFEKQQARQKQQQLLQGKGKGKDPAGPSAAGPSNAGPSSSSQPLAARITGPKALSARITDPDAMKFGDQPIDWSADLDYGEENHAWSTASSSQGLQGPATLSTAPSALSVPTSGASTSMEVDEVHRASAHDSSTDQGTDTSDIYADGPPSSK